MRSLNRSVKTRFVTNITVLDSHVKRPKQCHLQSVGLKGQALVTRWWVFLWCSCMVRFSSPLESFSWRWAGRLWFLAIFPSLLSRSFTFPFILVSVHCPSSTCWVNLSKTDTCPISQYPKSLGVVVKAKECGSVRCKVLNGCKVAFP